MTEKTLQKIDIFISSPGDVNEERKIASEVIEQLNLDPYIADHYMLKPLAYEKIVPAAVGKTPQRTVDHYMILPDQSDIFICIMWSKMGTPVIDIEGKKYHSGTEYEFTTAYKANQKSEKPCMLLYRSMKNLPRNADSKQVELVRAFFKSFKGIEADFKGLYKNYGSNEEFKDILRHDLITIIYKIAPVPVYSPSELPRYSPQLKDFVTHNRSDEITKAMTYLQDHGILLISGIGGVGKTTLARALAETRPVNVPLPFWFDFGKKTDAMLGDVLEKLAGYLNVPAIAGFKEERKEAGQEDIDRLTGELQKREQAWLVFDNLETVLDDRHFHDPGMDLLFTSLCASTHNAKIIVTSRVLPVLRNGSCIIDVVEDEKQELKGLKPDFAVDYLKKNGLEKVERNKLKELAVGIDGHPLALKLLIELVKDFGVSDTLNDLGLYQKSKEDTIKKARRLFEKLAGDEKELLERISVFRKPENLAAITALFTEKTSRDAVRKLTNKSLMETDHDGKYWLHPLILEFAYDDLENKIEIHQLACKYYLSLPLPEKRTKKDDVQSLIEACHHASKAEKYDEAASIIFDKELFEDLDRWGEYKTLIELYSGLLPENHFSDIILLRDKQSHGAILSDLGLAYNKLCQGEKAIQYYDQSLFIAREIRDRRGEGNNLGSLGIAYSSLGQVEKAIHYYEQALAIAQKIGDKRGEGNHLGNLAIEFISLGQFEKAIQYSEQALAIAQKIGNKRGEGNNLGSLGNAYSSLGQFEKAIQYYEQALAIELKWEDRQMKCNSLGSLGNAYSSLGQFEKAIQFYREAIVISKEIGDRIKEGIWLGNLGNAYGDLGFAFPYEKKNTEALACLLLAKDILTQIKNPYLETTESNLNDLKEKLGVNEFENLIKEVEPRAGEIVKKILEAV